MSIRSLQTEKRGFSRCRKVRSCLIQMRYPRDGSLWFNPSLCGNLSIRRGKVRFISLKAESLEEKAGVPMNDADEVEGVRDRISPKDRYWRDRSRRSFGSKKSSFRS